MSKTVKTPISDMTEKQRKKYYLKKAVIIILMVFALLIVLYLLGKIILERHLGANRPIEQIDETYRTYNFYDVPSKDTWDKIDIYADEQYNELDSSIHINSQALGGTFLLDDIPPELQNGAHRFFDEYFDMLKTGNYKLYPELFSKRYKEKNTGFEKNINREFPPQMVYDIMITELANVAGQVVDGKECSVGIYRVEYKIFKNSGLFRNDIGRDIDMGKDTNHPLLFELITFDGGSENEKTYINNLYTESSIAAQNKN